MAELYLVRHGQASFGQANYDQLSEMGHMQSRWLGEYFAERNIQFDRVLTGTQLRHQQTLDGIASGMKTALTPEQHSGFNEYDFQGLMACLGPEHGDVNAYRQGDKRAFYKGLKTVLTLWQNDELKGPLPERWADFQARVQAALQHACNTDARRVLVVSSGGPIGTMVAMAMQAPVQMGLELNLQIRNSSVCHFYFNRDNIRLAMLNSVAHLDVPSRLSAITYG